MPIVKGVRPSDDVCVAIRDVPVADVAQQGLVGRLATRPEIPWPEVEECGNLQEPESCEVWGVRRRQQRGQERRPFTLGLELRETQHVTCYRRVDDRAGEEIDHRRERQVEEREAADD